MRGPLSAVRVIAAVLATGLLVALTGAGAGCGRIYGGDSAAALRTATTPAERPPGLRVASVDGALLASGSWVPAVRARLEAYIRTHGRPDLPEPARPAVVIELEGAAAEGDLAVSLYRVLLEHRAFVFGDTFWDTIPVDLGRGELQAALARVVELEGTRIGDPYGEGPETRSWLTQMRALLPALAERDGPGAVARWLARSLAGMKPAELRDWTRRALRQDAAPALEELVDADGFEADDGLAAPMWTRFAIYEEMVDLVAALQRHGFDVWIVSSANQWSVEVAAQRLGVPAHHAVGLGSGQDAEGRINGVLVAPIAHGTTRPAALAAYLGRVPSLVIAHGREDLDLLASASDLAVVMDPDQDLTIAADERGWLVQPAFLMTE